MLTGTDISKWHPVWGYTKIVMYKHKVKTGDKLPQTLSGGKYIYVHDVLCNIVFHGEVIQNIQPD
jgi:hypothetical protein